MSIRPSSNSKCYSQNLVPSKGNNMFLLTYHGTIVGTDNTNPNKLIQLPLNSDKQLFLKLPPVEMNIVKEGPLNGYEVTCIDNFITLYKGFYLCAEYDEKTLSTNRTKASIWERFYLIPADWPRNYVYLACEILKWKLNKSDKRLCAHYDTKNTESTQNWQPPAFCGHEHTANVYQTFAKKKIWISKH